MSLYIPDDIKNIMYKYKHNLEMKEVCNELEKSFYTCTYCSEHSSININPIFLSCKVCQDNICLNCSQHLNMAEKINNECLDCLSKEMYIEQIERILGKKLECHEDDRFLTLLRDCIDYDILEIVNHLKYIESGRYKYGQELHDDISIFISSEFDQNNTSEIGIDFELDYGLESDDAGSNRMFF